MNMSSNKYLESGPMYVKPPDIKDLKIKNPDDYITQLNLITSPKDRLKNLFISTVNITTEPTYEAQWIRMFMISGMACGFVSSFILNCRDIHQDYIRQHNASVFEGKYRGNRHFWDTLAYRCAGRSFKYGLRAGALATMAGVIGISSITYRNKLYLPDWIIGYTTMGALSRLWIGPRGMAAGAAIWFSLSMVGFGMFRLMEKSSGTSISELEYLSHKQWILSRQAQLNRNHVLREEELMRITQESLKPSNGGYF